MPLLEIKNLSVHFTTDEGIVRAVDNLSLFVDKGETLCLVGESGCGKSVTSAAIMRLLPEPPAKIKSGSILFNNNDLLKTTPANIQRIRGDEIAMIFQDPMVSLNPVFTIGFQIAEAILQHQKISKAKAWDKAISLLKQVHIPDPKRRAEEYPHQLSGGMRQRAMIAIALSCSPKLLIADEPTTALDVTVQAQILDLLNEIKQEREMAILFITHDLGVVAEIADRVVVLYAGMTAEEGTAEDIFNNAQHPYTIGLMNSIPQLGQKNKRLTVIPGTLPDPTDLPKGCRFYERCSRSTDTCKKYPPKQDLSKTHNVYCFHSEK